MSRQTCQLLDAFDALPVGEKRIFTAEFFRRALPFDSGRIDDEQTAQAADALFAALDEEEEGASSAFGESRPEHCDVPDTESQRKTGPAQKRPA